MSKNVSTVPQGITVLTASLTEVREERTAAGAVLLFTATLFTSAFLLFLVEPMIARMVLPLLGGAPAVWNTCVVFFQAVMLAGYAYAHGATGWLGVRRQSRVQAVLVLVPTLVLPFAIARSAAPPTSGSPIGWLLLVLLGSVGLPFFVLSSTATVLQKWFSQTNHRAARDPYFLYVASNVGSLLALLAYPLIVEPRLTLQEQGRLWTAGYAVYVVLSVACAATMWRSRTAASEQVREETSPAPSWGVRARWIAWSFVPSSLMLGVTSYLSTDIAAVPLLWIVPLALYLVTFIVAFGRGSIPAANVARRALPLLMMPMILLFVGRFGIPLSLAIALHLLTFVAAGLVCHGALSATRPKADHLTEFYLWIAFGGMLGGMFNSLLAPVVFTGIAEYPIALLAACLLAPQVRRRASVLDRPAVAVGLPIGIGIAAALIVIWSNNAEPSAKLFVAALAIPTLLTFRLSRRPAPFTAALALMLIGGQFSNAGFGAVEYADRTFFGVYRVRVDHKEGYRFLLHGTTLHGVQRLDPARRREPVAYYHRTGPVGQALQDLPAASRESVGVIGLGTGGLATYARPGQSWVFYEIDPAVERIARNASLFTYLQDCGPECRVVLGDARLSVAREPERAYDVLIVDAFSSDAIPMHLMTTEAFALYLSRLRPGGVIVFHISNRHLVLAPVLTRLAAAHGLVALRRNDQLAKITNGKIPSEWMVMARAREDLGPLATDARWQTPAVPAGTPLWTDDFSNILSVLRR
jgi:hypothetical protein